MTATPRWCTFRQQCLQCQGCRRNRNANAQCLGTTEAMKRFSSRTSITMMIRNHSRKFQSTEQLEGKAADVHLRMEGGDDELRRIVAIVRLAGKHARHSSPAQGAYIGSLHWVNINSATCLMLVHIRA